MKKTTKKRNVEKIQRYTYFCYFLLVPGALFPTSDAVLYPYNPNIRNKLSFFYYSRVRLILFIIVDESVVSVFSVEQNIFPLRLVAK